MDSTRIPLSLDVEISLAPPYLDVKMSRMEDEVDRLVAGWRRALPGLDVSPLEVLSRVSRLAKHLDRQRSAVFARHDLETWTFDVLAALRRADNHELSPG